MLGRWAVAPRPIVPPPVALSVLAALCSACVATARSRPTSSDAAAGPPPAPVAERTAGQLVARTPRAPAFDAEPDPKARPDSVWVRGYWHWSGVRWEWVPGRWEKRFPAWVRRP